MFGSIVGFSGSADRYFRSFNSQMQYEYIDHTVTVLLEITIGRMFLASLFIVTKSYSSDVFFILAAHLTAFIGEFLIFRVKLSSATRDVFVFETPGVTL